MRLIDFKEFAESQGVRLIEQREIAAQAAGIVTARHSYNREEIKQHFDSLLDETHEEIYRLYLQYERAYGHAVLTAFGNFLVSSGRLTALKLTGAVLSEFFEDLDRFFLSLAQGRKSRAGKAFEEINNSLFKQLGYPFDEQVVINGKPDFVMPSFEHFKRNPMDCIIFTTKRTVRERWRQIVTEGTRGLGFFLATIDDGLSARQLQEMLDNRIYILDFCTLKTECLQRLA